MWTILTITLLVLAVVTALGIHDLQHWLEGWDYRRHAQD
jgi:hypothetical protein